VDDDFEGLPGVDDPDEFHTALDAMLQFLKEKVGVPADQFYALEAQARQRAFAVSGVADLDIVSDVWEAIESAVKNGETLEDFRERVAEKLESEWGGENPGRIETIFRTNVQTAYSAGRQVQNSQAKDTHPYLGYSVVDDDRTSSICRPLLKVVVPQDSSFAASHHPPLHFNCRTDEVALTEAEARERGGADEDLPDVQADDGFGDPFAEFEPDLSSKPPELANLYELKVLR
jgi:SPP1 gp7 family putative phage head morphogenesis protein